MKLLVPLYSRDAIRTGTVGATVSSSKAGLEIALIQSLQAAADGLRNDRVSAGWTVAHVAAAAGLHGAFYVNSSALE
jgi:hypothetical protein